MVPDIKLRTFLIKPSDIAAAIDEFCTGVHETVAVSSELTVTHDGDYCANIELEGVNGERTTLFLPFSAGRVHDSLGVICRILLQNTSPAGKKYLRESLAKVSNLLGVKPFLERVKGCTVWLKVYDTGAVASDKAESAQGEQYPLFTSRNYLGEDASPEINLNAVAHK